MKFKNMSTLIACGALVAAIGAVSVSASSPFTTLQVKVEDGVKQYSTDDGRTWSTDAPQGYSEQDGVSTYSFGNPSDEGGKYLTRMEDGVKRHSADGGKTWSEQPVR